MKAKEIIEFLNRHLEAELTVTCRDRFGDEVNSEVVNINYQDNLNGSTDKIEIMIRKC